MSLVILDRDGVINQHLPDQVRSPEQFAPIAGSLEAIARLNHAGHRVVVATNQSGLARKLFDIETLNRIHERMYRHLAEVGGNVEAVFFCPHAPRDRCLCRKPRPGMLLDIAARLHVDLAQVPVVGDEMADVEAARAAGSRPILVRTGVGRESELRMQAPAGVEVYDDLASAVEAMLTESPSG